MINATEIFDADLNHWIYGTRFFKTDDNKYFVVDADTSDYQDNAGVKFIRRPTVVLYCTESASVTDLIPDHSFPPGTTAEEAISQLGYQLIT